MHPHACNKYFSRDNVPLSPIGHKLSDKRLIFHGSKNKTQILFTIGHKLSDKTLGPLLFTTIKKSDQSRCVTRET
jgi:hypothetical protein